MTKDEEQLNLLATFHYVVGAIGALFSCIPFFHVAMGIMLINKPEMMTEGSKSAPPPEWFGYLIIAMGIIFILIGWASAVCTIISGRFIARRKNRMFSFVMAAILCMFIPIGTVLGVLTIIALSKDSVQRLYTNSSNQSVDTTDVTAPQ